MSSATRANRKTHSEPLTQPCRPAMSKAPEKWKALHGGFADSVWSARRAHQVRLRRCFPRWPHPATRSARAYAPRSAAHSVKLDRPVGRQGGAFSQANAGAGANRSRKAVRAFTARVPQKPTTEAAATPSHGAAKRVAAPAATPTPHAISRRPRNRRSSRQPERARDFTAAARLATDAPAPWQAAAATPSPDLMPSQARRNRPLGGSRGSGGLAGTSAGLPGASSVRAAASRSGLLTTSARTAWRVSLTAWLTAWRTADSTAD